MQLENSQLQLRNEVFREEIRRADDRIKEVTNQKDKATIQRNEALIQKYEAEVAKNEAIEEARRAGRSLRLSSEREHRLGNKRNKSPSPSPSPTLQSGGRGSRLLRGMVVGIVFR